MNVTIKPSRAAGTVAAPPSKSMAHRLLICAGLSEGESVVRGLGYSEDIRATIACLRAMGAKVEIEGDTACIKGIDPVSTEDGSPVFLCNESGSTLRFFTPLCLISGKESVLTGSEYLFTRPLSVYEKIAKEQGLRFEKAAASLTVQGRLSPGIYEIPGDISSQFVTGLLFALPLLDGDSVLRLIPPIESRPYIEMTLSALSQFGIRIDTQGESYRIKGGQRYAPADVTVEGDYSNAAFFEALNYAGSQVNVTGLSEPSLQGDQVYKVLYKNIKEKIFPIDIADCPDLGPVLFAVAALCGGAEFIGTSRLRLKESDRAAAMQQELKKLGIDMTIGENTVTVHDGMLYAPDEPLFGHSDHRIVMALSVLLTVVGGTIESAQAVNKSFPDFFERLMSLGVELYGMDQ